MAVVTMADSAILRIELAADRVGSAAVRSRSKTGAAADSMAHEVHELVEPSVLQAGKAGHAALAVVDDFDDLCWRKPLVDVDQRRESWRVSRAVATVANGALCLVEHRAGTATAVCDQAARPGIVIGVNVNHAGAGIDRWSAPFRASIKAREDDCLLIERKRNKLAAATEGLELLERPLVNLRSACGQHVRGEQLAGVGRGG